jgi:hypothetical protein
VVEADGIPYAGNVVRSIAVETEGSMEVDLLAWGEAIGAAGVEKLAGTGASRVVADVLDKYVATRGYGLFDFSITKVGSAMRLLRGCEGKKYVVTIHAHAPAVTELP